MTAEMTVKTVSTRSHPRNHPRSSLKAGAEPGGPLDPRAPRAIRAVTRGLLAAGASGLVLLAVACGGGTAEDASDESAPTTDAAADSSASPTPQPPEPTPPPAVVFLSDDLRVAQGGCTRLEWLAEGAARVYLDGAGVDSMGETEACPEETTTYELLAAYADGSEVSRVVTVEVDEPEAAATEPSTEPAVAPTAVVPAATAAPTETPVPDVSVEFYPANGIHEIEKDDLCTSVTWSTSGVTAVQLERNADGRRDVEASGTEEVCFSERKIKYTLYFVKPDGAEDKREIEISRKN